MRVRRLHREEAGAVGMIVAVCLLALVGMLVLVVDLGRSIAVKRQMVAGTDAAALAAAQQCALGNSGADASAAAGAILAQNRSGATVTSFSAPGCGLPPDEPQIVVVESTVDVDYFFAGIFGFNSGPVVARAVAQWGVADAPAGAPVTVDYDTLVDCGITPDDPPEGELPCVFGYPKDTLAEPRWGVVDLENWGDAFGPAPGTPPCSVPASESIDIIENGGSFDPLPAPAYTCIDNGLSDSVWEAMEGRILIFPVMDFDTSRGTVQPNNPPLGGDDCTGADVTYLRTQGYDCQFDVAHIVGWVQLLVTSVDKQGPNVIVTTEYLGITTGGGIPGGGSVDFGVRAIRLVE